MPSGPRGEKRSADVIGANPMAAKIATGEIRDARTTLSRQRATRAGGETRSLKIEKEERSTITEIAAKIRWKQ